ncbi:MAG: EboA domain-containing protein [Planctomycetes bacterium]|nr:EboA domain-containing protein [Planctomycetota bacterium]
MDWSATIDRWLETRLDAGARSWLAERSTAIAGGGGARTAGIAVAHAARRIPERPLAPDPLPEWTPAHWSLRDAARVRLVLALAAVDPAWPAGLDALCREATLEEAVALHRGLPCYPRPEALRARAAAGVRSSMGALYEAVAVDNPYPAAWLDQGAWNQLVLKCFFVGAEAGRLFGWRARANPELALMLRDFARERRAACRAVDPALWLLAAEQAAPAVAAELAALQAADHQPSTTDQCPP